MDDHTYWDGIAVPEGIVLLDKPYCKNDFASVPADKVADLPTEGGRSEGGGVSDGGFGSSVDDGVSPGELDEDVVSKGLGLHR